MFTGLGVLHFCLVFTKSSLSIERVLCVSGLAVTVPGRYSTDKLPISSLPVEACSEP